MKYLCPRDFRRGEMEEKMKKRFVAGFLSFLLILTILPTMILAANDTVENIKTFSFIGGETSQEDIDAAFGEGVISYTSEEVNGETIYTIQLLKNINMMQGNDLRIGEYRENGPALPQMILDLNGCMITSQSIGLINNGNLIIRDTSQTKTGGIKYSTTMDTSSLVAISHQGGLLVIEGGTFICESGYAFTGYTAAVSTQYSGKTQINGGTFISDSSAVLSSGETIIYGGTFEAPYGMYAKASNGVEGMITIPEESSAIVEASSFAFVVQKDGELEGKIIAAGGNYHAPSIVGGVNKPDTKKDVSITGGSYVSDPSAWVSSQLPIARLTDSNNDLVFAVGENAISNMMATANKGNQLSILSGDIVLENVPSGIEVTNEGQGNVKVNGVSVKDIAVISCLHTLEKVQAIAPTCTQAGYIEYWTCKICNKLFKDAQGSEEISLKDTIVQPLTHHAVKIEWKDPTTMNTGNITYWYCAACERYFSDAALTKEITKEETIIPCLPMIIAGANRTWRQGSNDTLSFTSNAEYVDFIQVMIDDKILDPTQYTVVSGSTIVNLQPAYLITLKPGTHKLQIVSKNGSAETQFIILEKAKEPIETTPTVNDEGKDSVLQETADTQGTDTGSKNNMLLWGVLFVVAGIGMGAVFIYSHKKNHLH